MPKLIDYPRTGYTGAWEVAEIVDDTGGKCALETCARKLNRKVSGSFKAIVGSAVKFGLLTSKREILTTTTLFRRIKHAYDKQEELLFHREAFLTPPLFTQLCRKFRSRELPVAMLDVLLIREFEVEEINAQSVAKAFIDGARMVGLLDEHNIIADIDLLATQQPARRELASPSLSANVFRQKPAPAIPAEIEETNDNPLLPPLELEEASAAAPTSQKRPLPLPLPPSRPAPATTTDTIAYLFGLDNTDNNSTQAIPTTPIKEEKAPPTPVMPISIAPTPTPITPNLIAEPTEYPIFRIQLVGPGINTELEILDVEDLALVKGFLAKIERQLMALKKT